MDPVGLHCLIRSGSSRIQFDCTVGSDQDPVGSGWTALFDQIRIQSDPVGQHHFYRIRIGSDPVGLQCLIRSGSSRIRLDCIVWSDQNPVGLHHFIESGSSHLLYVCAWSSKARGAVTLTSAPRDVDLLHFPAHIIHEAIQFALDTSRCGPRGFLLYHFNAKLSDFKIRTSKLLEEQFSSLFTGQPRQWFGDREHCVLNQYRHR